MASKKKESEGIALLSMYNDEEDEDIDDMEEDEPQKLDNGEDIRVNSESSPPLLVQSETSLPNSLIDNVSTPTPPQSQNTQVSLAYEKKLKKETLTMIVDYGHDETAMSPEPEEGEISISGGVMFSSELQTTSVALQARTPPVTGQIQATPPQPSDQPDPSQFNNGTAVNYGNMEIESLKNEETATVSEEIQRDIDALNKFLPPPPNTKCSEELQEKINRFLALKRAGKSFNAEVRNRKEYRNPDFLVHAVSYQGIDQIGSCFSKDVFDPYGYDKSDYCDELEADMKHEIDRKEQERKRNSKVEFTPGGAQPGTVSMAPKLSMPLQGAPTVASTGLHSKLTHTDGAARESRLNKKSKWDKV
ncbi:hypothetical protein MKX01_038416 [Papaver californicum]|nr:hypothetical protein MKX01_038416 [Papaver californicum]